MRFMIRFALLLALALPAHGQFFNNYDHEARSWYRTSGSTVSPRTKVAATRWMLQTRAAGLRSTIVRANLNAGDNLTTSLVPIVKDFGSATDPKHGTDPTYTEANGLTVSGLNILETGFNPTNLTANAAGLAIYLGGTVAPEGSIPIGCAAFGGNDFHLVNAFTALGETSNIWGSTGRPVATDTNGTGFYMSSRLSSATNGVKIYRNGNRTGESTSVTGSPPNTAGSAGGVYYMGINNAGSAAFNVTNKAGRGYEINRGRTDNQAGASYRIWQRFQTTLGRQTTP